MTASATSITIAMTERCAVPDLAHAFRAMACEVNVRISSAGGPAEVERVFDEVVDVFRQVEHECTRFDPGSGLMRANAAGDRWHSVGPYCFDAIREAALAHERTAGLFDPRVFGTLTALGYDRSLPFEGPLVELPPTVQATVRGATDRWAPGFDASRRAVRIGSASIDLGGIGKGLAVRWAADRVRDRCSSFFIEAGGDGYFSGPGPAGAGWQVGVEDPHGGTSPLAVLNLTDRACATSSTRVRRWTVGGRPVHHLIDPRTGEPATGGLSSVSVIAVDPAMAEVWSKVLFLYGTAGIAEAARAANLAAVWVDESGALGNSPAAEPFVIWRST